jgi:hypothetical protein
MFFKYGFRIQTLLKTEQESYKTSTGEREATQFQEFNWKFAPLSIKKFASILKKFRESNLILQILSTPEKTDKKTVLLQSSQYSKKVHR